MSAAAQIMLVVIVLLSVALAPSVLALITATTLMIVSPRFRAYLGRVTELW